MSTKNLARTVIEGGRHRSNKWDRRNSHAEERARLKNYLKEVTLDPENYEEYDVEPIEHIGKSFDDKIGPIYRWLGRQVGRLWDEVRADIAASFDTRTTAGRHIVYDHLISSVQITPEVRFSYRSDPDDPTASYYRNDFYVDEEGVLQKKRYIGRRYHTKIPDFDTNQLCNWLNGRIVGKVGKKLFWFVPADKSKKRGGYSHNWRLKWGYPDYYYGARYNLHFQYERYEIIYKKDSLGQVVVEDGQKVEIDRVAKWVNGTPIALRQSRQLNAKELKYWGTIPEYHQTKVLELSPTYPEDLKPKPYRYY